MQPIGMEMEPVIQELPKLTKDVLTVIFQKVHRKTQLNLRLCDKRFKEIIDVKMGLLPHIDMELAIEKLENECSKLFSEVRCEEDDFCEDSPFIMCGFFVLFLSVALSTFAPILLGTVGTDDLLSLMYRYARNGTMLPEEVDFETFKSVYAAAAAVCTLPPTNGTLCTTVFRGGAEPGIIAGGFFPMVSSAFSAFYGLAIFLVHQRFDIFPKCTKKKRLSYSRSLKRR